MKKTILIVDDTEDTHIILKEFLTDSEFNVHSVHNGQEAIDFLMKRTIPDLILLDLMMPEVDGLSFLKIIRRDGVKKVEIQSLPAENLGDSLITDPLESFNARLKNIKVVIISAKDSIEDVIAVKKLGISGYIRKPFNAETVCNSIEKVLDIK